MKPTSSQGPFQASTFTDVLIVIVTLALLAALFLPALVRPKTRSSRASCVSNLKQISLAFRMWSNDHNDSFPWKVSTNQGGSQEYSRSGEVFRHFQAVSNELNSPKILKCPSDTRRSRAVFFTNFSNQNISYFIQLDSNEARPSTLLAGDRNLTLDGVAVKSPLVAWTTNKALGWTKEMHKDAGSLALSDGSVSQATEQSLTKALRDSGIPTNYFAVPVVP